MLLANRDLNHGFQARYPSPTTLAPVERIGSDTKSSYWSNFRRRRRVRTTSCLTYFKSRGAPAPRTQLLTISPGVMDPYRWIGLEELENILGFMCAQVVGDDMN